MARSPTSAPSPRADTRDAHWRTSDTVAVAFTALCFGWIAFDWGGERAAAFFDFLFFLPAGLVVGALQWRVARQISNRRERLAWQLLAAASLARFVSGNVWSAWLLIEPVATPVWIVLLATLFLVFGNAALVIFPSAPLRRTDRLRFGLDGGIITVGSLLIVWFFALGPFLRAPGVAAPKDVVYTIGDSLAVVLAAVLYLRSAKEITRSSALLLLFAYVLQVAPDILLSAGSGVTYRPGDAIEAVWYSVWALKWIAARWALFLLAARPAEATAPHDEYRSGIVPTAFLVSATGVLMYQLAFGTGSDNALFLFGSVALSLLLVLRQFVELREGDRLHRAHAAEHAWFGAVLQHAYDVLALVDSAGRMVYASPATERLTGTNMSAATEARFADVLHPEDAPRLSALLSTPRFDATVLSARVRAASGEWRDTSLRLQDLRHEPQVGAVVINGHDVSREAQLAGRLRESREVEALGVFAGGLAHDLNNFLSVIGAHVELLAAEVPAQHEQAHADLQAIATATMRSTALTSGLLSLSRRKTQVREVVNIESLLTARFAKAGVALELTRAAPHMTVRADPTALQHAVDALLNDQFANRATRAPCQVSLQIEELDRTHAERLALPPGVYVAIHLSAESTRTLVMPRLAASWESAPDDLGTMLVHAAVREAGGAIETGDEASAGRVTMFLPGATR